MIKDDRWLSEYLGLNAFTSFVDLLVGWYPLFNVHLQKLISLNHPRPLIIFIAIDPFCLLDSWSFDHPRWFFILWLTSAVHLLKSFSYVNILIILNDWSPWTNLVGWSLWLILISWYPLIIFNKWSSLIIFVGWYPLTILNSWSPGLILIGCHPLTILNRWSPYHPGWLISYIHPQQLISLNHPPWLISLAHPHRLISFHYFVQLISYNCHIKIYLEQPQQLISLFHPCLLISFDDPQQLIFLNMPIDWSPWLILIGSYLFITLYSWPPKASYWLISFNHPHFLIF